MELIAEIGWNHMGDIDLAMRMIKAAKDAGATHAKFQTWREADLKSGPWDGDGRREIYQKAQLSDSQFQQLKNYCDSVDVQFMTSLFNERDVDAMAAIEPAHVKIPSPEIANKELLEESGRAFDKVFLSTGASTELEIDQALKILQAGGADVVLMHCVSSYPCRDEKVNLPRISALQKKHDKIGFSDHTSDELSALFAIAMGVVSIEKHFTIDNDLPGRDNKFALLPQAFSKIAVAMKRYQEMTIDYGIEYQPEEVEVREVYRGRWK